MPKVRPKLLGLSAKRRVVRGVSGAAGANCQEFIRARQVEHELDPEDVGVRVRLAP